MSSLTIRGTVHTIGKEALPSKRFWPASEQDHADSLTEGTKEMLMIEKALADVAREQDTEGAGSGEENVGVAVIAPVVAILTAVAAYWAVSVWFERLVYDIIYVTTTLHHPTDLLGL